MRIDQRHRHRPTPLRHGFPSRRRLTSWSGLFALPFLVAAGCGNPDDFAQTGSEIHTNPGSTSVISQEPTAAATGAFKPVMYFQAGGEACTATVLGPYAVLTANHCVSGLPPASVPSSVFIRWTDLGSFAAGKVLYNPYLNAQFTPSWWVTLNSQQKAQPGGRQDDWPAQHDQVIVFVPGLTPTVLAQNHITPALIGAPPAIGPITYMTVGVASTGTDIRSSVFSRIINAIPGTITQNPRDGYITEDQTTPNFGSVDPGDSGGPIMGFQRITQLFGGSVDVSHFVLGTAQNTGGDKAPLAYATGTTLTANQTLTIRLNSLWAQAQVDDADGDGLPTACDRNPASPNAAGDNLCPAEVGAPTGASLGSQLSASTAVPLAALACKPGYTAVALRGRSGALVDDLAVKCQALGCFTAPGGTCNQTYWTDDFGGTGGVAFEADCAGGSLLTGIQGQQDPGIVVTSLQPRCNTFLNVKAGSTAGVTALGSFGGAGTAAYTDACPGSQTLVGFQARTSDARWVTGLQPICSNDLARMAAYVGGTGGIVNDLSCPAGSIATGVMYQTDPAHTSIAFSGVLCAPQATVQAGQAVTDDKIVVAHGTTQDNNAGIVVPAMVEPLIGAHTPSSPTANPVKTATCPTGYALSRISGGVSTGVLGSITTLGCRRLANTAQTATVSVNAGNLSLAVVNSSCPGTAIVDGLYTQSGALTDGIAAHCNHL